MSEFWDCDPEEITEIWESYQRMRWEEDEKLAHYASASLLSGFIKKPPKPEKLRRLKPAGVESSGEDRGGKVVSLDSRRERDKLRAAFAATRGKKGTG
jgi:hypothetical protein